MDNTQSTRPYVYAFRREWAMFYKRNGGRLSRDQIGVLSREYTEARQAITRALEGEGVTEDSARARYLHGVADGIQNTARLLGYMFLPVQDGTWRCVRHCGDES